MHAGAEIRDALTQTLGFQGTIKTLYTYVYQLSRSLPTPGDFPADAGSDPTKAKTEKSSSDSPRRFADSLDPAWVEAMRTRPKRPKPSLVERLNKPI